MPKPDWQNTRWDGAVRPGIVNVVNLHNVSSGDFHLDFFADRTRFDNRIEAAGLGDE